MQNRRLISSSMTYFYKRVFPVLWASIIFLLLLLVLLADSNEVGVALVLFAIFAAASFFLFRLCIYIKHVEIDEDYLYVSNFKKEIKIPRSDILSVSQTPLGLQHITILFKESSDFGRKICLIPQIKYRFLSKSKSELLQELRKNK